MFREGKRKFNPWIRDWPDDSYEPIHRDSPKPPKFSAIFGNDCLDYPTKVAGLKVSSSVVSIVSYSGDEEIFQCTGIIIKAKRKSAIVLTSAYLLRCPSGGDLAASDVKVVVHVPGIGSFDGVIKAFDFHFCLAAIKIKPKTRLKPASLACLNHSLSINPNQIPTIPNGRPFGLRKHSDSFSLIPGDSVVAIGCYFEKPYPVMAAPGVFCLERSTYDCKELSTATCRITRCGIGGPLVNCYGDVIGICFYDLLRTPFLPINVALTWWEKYKKHGELRRPWLGMDLTNLYSACVELLAGITRKCPNISGGIFVEEVMPGSSADAAGIKHGDVIIQFGGKPVHSFLELLKESWEKIGEAVEMVVVRKEEDLPVHLSMVVDEVKPDKIYNGATYTSEETGG